MALVRTLAVDENGQPVPGPDGRPLWHYASDGHVLLTGPAVGQMAVSDGTVYDVTPDAIEVDPDHAGELAHLIGVHLEDVGHPRHTDGEPFVHTCTDDCGALAREQ